VTVLFLTHVEGVIMLTLFSNVRRFGSDKSGAVTVDWVALTAAVVVIGIGLVYTIFGTGTDGVGGLVTNLGSQLNTAGGNITGVDLTAPTAGASGGAGT
jgi:hypothetical protein